MKVFFTSDLHFHHRRVIDFGYRPFKSLRHMHHELIRRWNLRVSRDDIVYILGDFNFKGTSSTLELLNALNGQKVLIYGNHDKSNFLEACFVRMLGKGWELIHNPDDSSNNYVMHGHIHLPYAKRVTVEQYDKFEQLRVNVNTELWDYTPVSISQIEKELSKFKEKRKRN